MTTKTLFQRFHGLMADLCFIEKGSRNSHQGYSYTGHDTLTAHLHPLYVKHGIVRSAEILSGKLDDKCCFIAECLVTWVNVDSPEDRHTVRITSLAPSTAKVPQPAATQSGVALSYAVKTAEFKLFSLTGDDTPDAGSEEQTRGEQRAQERPVADVSALVERLEKAGSVAELQATRAEVKRHIAGFSEIDRARLTKAKDAACERLGWTDGAPQGGKR